MRRRLFGRRRHDNRYDDTTDTGSSGLEFGSDGVDAVMPLGGGMSVDTDGEVGFDVGGGMRIEADGDVSFGGFSTGD